ncbi:zf-CCHC domain-containing protein [Tanacetum coccineum]
MKSCETCGSTVQTTTDHNDIGWFRRGKALQAKKSKALKSTKCDIRKPIWYLDSGCLRNITGVKSYLHKYVEQPGPKIVFGDDSTCATEGYGSVTCNEVVPFEEQSDDLKNKLAKNNEAKMVLYNALPKKEYERNFMCKMAKDIWQSLLITHQGNIQVKDNKIDLLVQQYEQFTILEEESIDSGFARFNTIITSRKALDEGFSSKNYVRKFLRALHPKWRAKVMAEESKDLSSLALDELICNLKVHEVVMEKDSKIYRGKKERVKSIALKAKKKYSDDETSTFESDDEEYAMAVRNFKKFFRKKGKFVRQPREEKKSFRQRDKTKGKSNRKCFRCDDPNHLIRNCPKPPNNKDQKAFIGGSWSDSENDAEDKTNDETCLMAQSSNEVCLRTCLEPDEWIKDIGCFKHMTGNKSLFSTYKAYDGGNVVFASNLKGKIIGKGLLMNIKENHPNSFKNTSNFDSNGGDDGVINGGLDQRIPGQHDSSENDPYLNVEDMGSLVYTHGMDILLF